MNLRTVFIGFPKTRAKRIVESLARSANLEMDVRLADDAGEDEADLASRLDVVFVSTEIGWRRLGPWVEQVRRDNRSVPIVLTYGREPDGWTFQISSRYDCWLFSDTDCLGRGLNLDELGEALRVGVKTGEIKSRLIDISACSGPCSTGD